MRTISVYTVGLGDVNEEYLKDITQRTGGKYILADNTTELEDIYVTLQKYIINNYVLTYTVTDNSEEEARYLMAVCSGLSGGGREGIYHSGRSRQ